jgi:hypothetical protein
MAEFRVAVDPETADALQTEVDLLGFGDGDEYLSWIVENRASIEQGTEAAELLDAYHERLVTLEERLAAEGVDPASVDADSEPVSDATPPADSGSSSRAGGGDGSASAGGASPRRTRSSGVDTIETSRDRSAPVETGGTGGGDSAVGAGASGAADARAGGDSADEPRAASDGGVSAQAEITSMHLRPERVQRVREDPVSDDADSLADVEADRLDELSRRAVAETRKQLDREVETGLDYSASTSLGDSDVRPGEDLADLDALDVPGRTQGLVEARRVVVGRALAYLHDAGSARKRDFIDEIYGDWPAGYETPAGWWRCVRESLKQIDAVDGGQIWRYEK